MFENLHVGKGMTMEDHLGILLRDDKFLNIMAEEPNEEIKRIWCEMLGKATAPSNATTSNMKRGSSTTL